MNQMSKVTADGAQDAPAHRPRRRWSRRHGGIAVIALVVVLGGAWKLVDKPQAQAQAAQIATVGHAMDERLTELAVELVDDDPGGHGPSYVVEVACR